MKPLLIAVLATFVHCHLVKDGLAAVAKPQHDNRSSLRKLGHFSVPNLKGCERTKACYIDLLTSTGFSADPFPNYGTYLLKMTKLYSSGKGLQQYCGTFDAVSQCFSQESDSCRTPTVFAVLFDLSDDDAYRFATDLDLRKILCDNQEEMQDPCLNSMAVAIKSRPVQNDAQASCDNVAADLSAVISQTDEWGCPDPVLSLFCQISAKTKEIETMGACDGRIPKCWTDFHSCDRIQACFDQFYDAVDKAGVKSPLPDYPAFASGMKRRFENADGIDEMCSLQSTLHACLLRHVDKNCPLNAASFRSMYNMNYEQAYAYSTDFNLRKAQCMYKEGVKQNSCLIKAKPLLKVCEPNIPHNLTLGQSCTDLRLAMKCDNFAVRQACPEEAQQMYCVTQGIIYEQAALGFCDGWMPVCEQKEADSTTVLPTTSSTRRATNTMPSTWMKTTRTTSIGVTQTATTRKDSTIATTPVSYVTTTTSSSSQFTLFLSVFLPVFPLMM